MRCVLMVFLFVCVFSCGREDALENSLNDTTAQDSTDIFIDQCTDPLEPKIERLTEIQNPVSGDFLVPEDLRLSVTTIYTKCIAIIQKMLSQTYTEFSVDQAGKECMQNAEEAKATLPDIKISLQAIKEANLGTKEGRGEAFGGMGMLQLPITLLHGRVALNYEVNCKLANILN